MLVKLKEINFYRFGKPQINYKILNEDNCCKKMKDLIKRKKIIPVKFESKINVSSEIGEIQTNSFTYALSFLEEQDVVPINYCPFCGQQIISEIEEKADVSQEVNKLQQELKKYTEQLKFYPNSSQIEITNKISEINNKLNYYYYIN